MVSIFKSAVAGKIFLRREEVTPCALASSSVSALTRFYRTSVLRREGRSRSSLPQFFRKRSWILWMAQKSQQQAICAAADGVRTNGERLCEAVVEAEEAGKHRRSSLVVVSFYKFADLPDFAAMRKPLRDLSDVHRVSGGIILAPEGINGSICGTREAVDNVITSLESDVRLKDLRRNEAPATEEDEDLHHGQTEKSPLGAGEDAPFRWGHVRVKLKNEVVPLGVPHVKPAERVGKYVEPKDWNALISAPGTVLIDVRNDYEIRIGKFRGALDPKTEAFREFPAWVDKRFGLATNRVEEAEIPIFDTSGSEGQYSSKPEDGLRCLAAQRELPRIAMYCTGGIRCEKATSYLLDRGLNEVYHLEGGILKYLEEVTPGESLWEGECFVFDKRVSVDHGLNQGTYCLCYACKKPVNDDDKRSLLWEDGVSCPYCFSLKTDQEKDRARARQIQFKVTGEIGGPSNGRGAA